MSQKQMIINLIPIQDLSKIDRGIFMSAPIHYFSFKPHQIVLQSLDSFDPYSCPRNSNIIIGGGSILGGRELKPEEQTEEYINKKAEEFVNNKNPNYFAEYRAKKILRLFKYFTGQKILWGIGDLTDEHFKISIYRQIYKEATLIGLRNYPPASINLDGDLSQQQKIFYIPDVSCCHKLLEVSQAKSLKQVLYLGKLFGNWRKKYKDEIFKEANNKFLNIRNTSFETIMEEINQSRKVITNAYHIYYWCHLIKKPVELDRDTTSPFQIQFDTFDITLTLEKAKELNNHFYKKVIYMINQTK